MKKETLPKGILQGLIINFLILNVFIFVLLNNIYSEYNLIDEKKDELINIQTENKNIIKNGLDFNNFKSLFKKNNVKDKIYLNNLLNDTSKDLEGIYNENLVNSGTGNYDDFISKVSKEIKNKELNSSGSEVKAKIEKILPYYKDNSNLSGEGLTDFKFINYVEKLIHNFELDYVGDIGIGEFILLEGNDNKKKKGKKSQIEGEIYSFKLPLTITGKKKNIIDFIYYLENVGNIDFSEDGKDIVVKNIKRKRSYTNKKGEVIKNDFYNLPRYFIGEKDIFNNLIVDIDNIILKDYIDSSFDPISYDDGKTNFINYLKTTQSDEKYEVSLDLKFYVKGLERYKTKKFIDNVSVKYKKLLNTISSAVKTGKSNKTKLDNKSKYSLIELQKYNSFLISISKDIEKLKDKKRLETELGNVYSESQKYEKIFEKIDKKLDIDLKNVSEKIYNNYKKD